MRKRRGLLAAGLMIALVGCVPQPSGSTAQQPAEHAIEVDTPELQRLRLDSGIQDCPAEAQPTAESSTAAGGASGADAGQLLPHLVLPCLGSEASVDLALLPRDQGWVINLWAQWCPPCREEAPHLAEAWRRWGGEVHFLGIDYNDPQPELALEFASLNAMGYPQLADLDHAVDAPLRIQGVPQTLFIDTEGRIVYRQVGVFSSAQEIQTILVEHGLLADEQ